MENQQGLSSWPLWYDEIVLFLKQQWKYSTEEKDGLLGYTGL